VFENRVLRRIFGPRRDEETLSWIKLYNEKLRKFYSSRRMIRSRRMILGGECSTDGKK
jgi:hypothetical protein